MKTIVAIVVSLFSLTWSFADDAMLKKTDKLKITVNKQNLHMHLTGPIA